jgi:tetratricopeptide (TPR) repeat protein
MSDGRFRNRQGSEVISRLEATSLERLASLTGGRFAIAASGADIPAMVESAASDLDRVRLEGRQRTVVVDYFQWFLMPAILFLMASIVAATRWRGVRAAPAVAAAAMFFVLLPPARGSTEADARRAMAERRYEDAKAAFHSLAVQHGDDEKAFRYSLAEGTAAYRAKDYPTARKAFSEALRSTDPEVARAAHHGLGNTLFQIGWKRLADGLSYPEIPESDGETSDNDAPNPLERLSDALLDTPDEAETEELTLGAFEKMAKENLAEWMAEESVGEGQTEGARRFNDLLTDWIDAVRHYDGASSLEDAEHNRKLAIRHLEKLREIFEQLEQNAQQIQAIPQPGEGPPQEGDPQSGEGDGEGEGGEPQDQDGEKPESGEENEEGQGDEDEPHDGEGGEDEQDEPQEGEKGDETESRPGESPEEAARRILRENADLQKGALSPGRTEFQRPEKDW